MRLYKVYTRILLCTLSFKSFGKVLNRHTLLFIRTNCLLFYISASGDKVNLLSVCVVKMCVCVCVFKITYYRSSDEDQKRMKRYIITLYVLVPRNHLNRVTIKNGVNACLFHSFRPFFWSLNANLPPSMLNLI